VRTALTKNRSVIFGLVVSLLTVFPMLVRGEEALQTGGVTIKADTIAYDRKTDTYRAVGNVQLGWDGVTLTADRALLSEAGNEAVAEGGVRLVKGGDVLRSERIRVNLLTEQGEVTNGDLFVKKSNFYIRGNKIMKVGENDYHLERGSFTSCDGDPPSWKFTASDLDVTIEDFARGRNALLYIKGIPVFYTPYLIFPVKRERQSGFLFPRIGSSTKKGFNLDIPYYWAISPSQEATFDLDIQSKRGAGTGLEYSYLRPHGSIGNVQGYHIYDANLGKGRTNLVVHQQEWFSPTLAFKSDVDLVTDHAFYRDFAEASGEYNRQVLDSSVSLTKNWQNYSLAGEVRYLDNLEASSNRGTQQKLPTIGFTALRQRLPGIPLYLGLDSSFVDFYHEDGINGQRLDFHPLAAIYYPLPVGLDVSARGGYRQRFYNAYGGTPGNGAYGVGLADAAATVATSFARVFDAHLGTMSRVRHTLVPEAGWAFVQEKSQSNLPSFDFDDRVLGQTMTTWALTNYLTGKFQDGDTPPSYRDLLSLRVSQGYQLSGARRDLLTLVDEGRRLTDLRLEADFTPLNELALFTDSRYNPYRSRLSTVATGFDLKDGRGDTTGLAYRFSREEVEYLEGKVGVSLVKPYVFNYTGRYSFDRGGFLESYYALEYRHQCWSVIFTYRDRSDDRSFIVNVSLGGIGSIGKVKAF
jgi:LPS-assembly protein